MRRPLRPNGAAMLCAALLAITPTRLFGQQDSVIPPGTLEQLAERSARAVVLIDVRTSADSRQGSGFVVDPDGIIITNHHVMRDARTARVKFPSGDVYDRVMILARDERRDIAILRIAGYNLPTLPMGDSDSVRIGTPIVLIGSPLGLENTVSTGIVSGRRQEPAGFQLLQVTAPASRGSSGGAVLGADGRVVGIAASQLGAGQNLNFAVPINYARGMIENLGQEPETVLQATTNTSSECAARPISSSVTRANPGMTFDVANLRGLVVDSEVDLGDERRQQTRITYRVIERVGGGPTRLERYYESETTRTTEPFGTQQTLMRERRRTIVLLDGLEPISSEGEIAWMTSNGWQEARHDIRFEGGRAVGIVADTAALTTEIDREVPPGVLLRDIRDLAFATLNADSLIGRSVEFTTFDPRTGTIVEDRYDVLGQETIDVVGEQTEVLRVNVASGLINQTVFFMLEPPRVAVLRVTQDGSRTERTTRIQRDSDGQQPPGFDDS